MIRYPEYILDEETSYNYNLKCFLADMKEIPKLLDKDAKLKQLSLQMENLNETKFEESPRNIYPLDGDNTLKHDGIDIEYKRYRIKDREITRKYEIIGNYFRKKYKDEDEAFDYWSIFIDIIIFTEKNWASLKEKLYLKQELNGVKISKNFLLHLLTSVIPLRGSATDRFTIDILSQERVKKDCYYEYQMMDLSMKINN